MQYKTAFVMAHKLREAMGATADASLSGSVEIDGAYFGGYVSLPITRRTGSIAV